jgi:hypothetical protein
MAPTLENYLMRKLNIKYGAARSVALLGRLLLGMEKDEPATAALRRECLILYGVLPAEYDDHEAPVQTDPSKCNMLYTPRAEILVSIQRPVAEIVNEYEEIIGPIQQRQQEQEQQEEEEQALLATQHKLEQSQDWTTETFEETSSEESVSGWTSKESAARESSEDEELYIETSPVLSEKWDLLEKEDDVSLLGDHVVIGELSSSLEESYSELLDIELRGIEAAQHKEEVVSLPDQHIFESSCSDDSSAASDPRLRGIDESQLRKISVQRRAMVLAYEERYGSIQKRIDRDCHGAPLEVKCNLEKGLDATEELTESDAADEEEEKIQEVSRKVVMADPNILVKELKEQRAAKEELRKREKRLNVILTRFCPRFQKTSSEIIVDENVLQMAATGELSFFGSLLTTIEDGGDSTDASYSVTSTSTLTLIKMCLLAVPPASTPAAMDRKEIVMAALDFLSSVPPPPNADETDTRADAAIHTAGSTDQLRLLPLIRPQQMSPDLENVSYQKVGHWKLVEIESQVATLEQVFCTAAKSMHGLLGSAFVPDWRRAKISC